MTVVAAPPEDLARTPEVPRGRVARVWSAPVWAHILALAVVLIALVPLVGTGGSFSADEGPAIIQARSLAEGDGWIVEHPLPEVDPSGDNYPLEVSARGPRGFVPFGKHPLYPLLLAGAAQVGGVTAMVLLSLAGTLAAAGLAAAIAHRLLAPLTRPTLWVVGLASPLLFDGYLVIAHTLGAAACAGAVLLAIVAIDRQGPSGPSERKAQGPSGPSERKAQGPSGPSERKAQGPSGPSERKAPGLLAALGVVPCIAFAVLLRNEALFLALALAATTAVIGLRRARLPALVVAGGAAVAGLSAHVLDRMWTRNIVGGGGVGVGGSISNQGAGMLAGRIKGLVVTWLTPTFSGKTLLALALFMMVAVLGVGAVLLRRRPGEPGPGDTGPILLLSGMAAAAACLALVLGPTNVVPGLLFAFPLVVPGVLLLRRSHLRALPVQVALGTFALFSMAVIATQYARGGSGEWGGRYFAIGIPILVPALLLAMSEAGRRLDVPTRRWVTASLVVCSLATAAMAVGSLRHYHRFTARITAMVDQVSQQDGATNRPVIIATDGITPRLSWPEFDRQRWLLARPDDLPGLLAGLRAADETRFTLVTRFLERDLRQLEEAGPSGPTEREVEGPSGPTEPAGQGRLDVVRRGSVAQWHVLTFAITSAPT